MYNMCMESPYASIYFRFSTDTISITFMTLLIQILQEVKELKALQMASRKARQVSDACALHNRLSEPLFEVAPGRVKQVIERREKWLQDNNLPLDTIMDDPQFQAFLAEVKAEFHGSDKQLERQAEDRAAELSELSVQRRMRERWTSECLRRAGCTDFWERLSSSGRWDPNRQALNRSIDVYASYEWARKGFQV